MPPNFLAGRTMEQEIVYSQKQIELMDKALELFAGNGYDNTSVRDIAREADVNIAMISYYFGSKEKLLEAIFARHLTHVRNILQQIVKARDLSPVAKIDKIIDTYIDAITRNRNFHVLMIREQVALKNDKLYEMIRAMKTRNFELMQNAVKLGEKQGYFRKGIDVRMLALTLFGTVNQAFTNKKYLCEVYKIEEADSAAFDTHIITKLRSHLKLLFRNHLSHEGNHK